jgi:hypothetical protein
VLGDDTYVGGFHYVGADNSRWGFASPVMTPGCANGSERFAAPPTEAACGGGVGATGGHGARNATVEDVSVEPFTVQNLFFAPPTRAGARVSTGITLRQLRSKGTWADGINFHGQHRDVLVEDCAVWYSGDDSFALWSIGAGADNITFRNNTAMYPHGSGSNSEPKTLTPACAEPCPCDAETWDGLRWCRCPHAPKAAYCRAAGCFANYGGQASAYENNTGVQCGGGAVVSFGARWAAIHGRRELEGLFGGAWNGSSSTRVVGNVGDASSARQCSFEAPIDPRTNHSLGWARHPGTVEGCDR